MYKVQSMFHERSLAQTSHHGILVSHEHGIREDLSIVPVLELYHTLKLRFYNIPPPAKLDAYTPLDDSSILNYIANDRRLLSYNPVVEWELVYSMWYFYDRFHKILKGTIGNIGYYESKLYDKWSIGTTNDGTIGNIMKLIRSTNEKPFDITRLMSYGDYVDNVCDLIKNPNRPDNVACSMHFSQLRGR